MLPKDTNCTAISVIPTKRSAEGSRESLKQVHCEIFRCAQNDTRCLGQLLYYLRFILIN